MKKRILYIIAALIVTSQFVYADGISRLEIQNLFKDTPGNASYQPFWERTYLNRPVSWKGSIFSIQYQQNFKRTEITMKVLPGTLMYDTVVYVPGDVTDKFKVKDEVSFSGTITRGIDMFGVKEVQVLIGRNMGDRFGDYIFSEQGFVNVNFLQKNNNSQKSE